MTAKTKTNSLLNTFGTKLSDTDAQRLIERAALQSQSPSEIIRAALLAHLAFCDQVKAISR